MKFGFLILTNLILLSFASCAISEPENELWTEQDAIKHLDSIDFSELIAAYTDVYGLSLIVKKNQPATNALKITKVTNYPLIIDSLVQTKTQAYQSIKYQTLYTIAENEVVVTYFQKIIHPSSNWQGQTPWQEIIVSRYPRLDKNLK